ncbi:MAG: hypothetical protein ACK501_05855 [Planctomycetota bacterium]|jgi:hypothetical protein
MESMICCLAVLVLALPLALAAGNGFCLLVLAGRHRLWSELSIVTAATVTTLGVTWLHLHLIPAFGIGCTLGILHLGIAWIAATRAEAGGVAKHEDSASTGPSEATVRRTP